MLPIFRLRRKIGSIEIVAWYFLFYCCPFFALRAKKGQQKDDSYRSAEG
jgi:hypothetical protein